MRAVVDVSAVPDQPTGAGVYVRELTRALGERDDIDLRLVARHGDAGRWHEVVPGAQVLDTVPNPRPVRLAWEQFGAPGVAKAIDADVWHGPHYTLPLRVGVPAVVTIHDMTFFDHPERHERAKVRFFRWMIGQAARRARVLVTVSETTAQRLSAILAPSAPVVVAPHGVDHRRFHPPGAAARDATDATALADAEITWPYLVFVGTIEPRKNVPALVDAFGRIANDHPELRLVLAGADGWGAAAVADAIARSPAHDRIVRLGYVGDDVVAALYRHAAAVVYASHAEGFGLPALEALACGAPLVTSSGSAMEEIAGDAAVLVAPGDVDLLAKSIDRVLTDRDLTEQLRAAGPATAAGFTWDACAAAHVDAYRLAVDVGSRAGIDRP